MFGSTYFHAKKEYTSLKNHIFQGTTVFLHNKLNKLMKMSPSKCTITSKWDKI